MTGIRVYILSDYGEHGADNVVATLDRNKIIELHHANFAERRKDWLYADELEELKELLDQDDVELLGKNDLGGGFWGQTQLHVIELEANLPTLAEEALARAKRWEARR